MSAPGTLVVVATPIGNLGDLSPRAVAALKSADVIAAEDTRRTRKLLSALDIPAGGRLVAVHGHNEAEMARRIVDEILCGRTVACVSDAGTPGISDPGSRLVRACIAAGIRVDAVPGPTAAIAALILSGFSTDRFVFEGFLPRKGKDRAARLAALEFEDRPVIVFESPARLGATLDDLAAALGPDRGVAIARELTKIHEEVWRGHLGECAGALPVAARGEVVVVLGPAAPPEPSDDAAVVVALEAELARGLSVKDAAGEVARRLTISRRRAYELAVGLKKGSASADR